MLGWRRKDDDVARFAFFNARNHSKKERRIREKEKERKKREKGLGALGTLGSIGRLLVTLSEIGKVSCLLSLSVCLILPCRRAETRFKTASSMEELAGYLSSDDYITKSAVETGSTASTLASLPPKAKSLPMQAVVRLKHLSECFFLLFSPFSLVYSHAIKYCGKEPVKGA